MAYCPWPACFPIEICGAYDFVDVLVVWVPETLLIPENFQMLPATN